MGSESMQRDDDPIPVQTRRPAVFFDRDGVLNENSGFVHLPGEFVWIPGALEAVKALNDLGYFTFVVTNQSGVARGYYEESDVRALHDWMNAQLRGGGAHIDAFVYCPHHLDAVRESYRKVCKCRKPQPGMLKKLMQDWPIEMAGSFLIGDKDTDTEAAEGAGIPGYKFSGGNLYDFTREILAVG